MAIYSWAWPAWFAHSSSLCKWPSIGESFWVGDGLMSTCLLSTGNLPGTELCRLCAWCQCLCELMCVSLDVFSWPCFLTVLLPFWLLQSYASPLPCPPSPKRKGLMKTAPLQWNVPVSLTLSTLSSCGSIYWLPSTAGGSFSDDGWMRPDLWV